jgi:hypothetical protein
MLIDVDKFKISLEKCNRTGGWVLRVFRVRKDEHYHHGAKITVLFAIKMGDPALLPHVGGSVQHPWHWVQCVHSVGTTINIFRDFCDLICLEIEQFEVVGTDDHRILIWDSLTVHHSAYVHQLVKGCQGSCRVSVVAPPQYLPKFVPNEYKICELTNILQQRKEPNWIMLTFENAVYQAAASIEMFDSTFEHCGYRWV